MNFTVIQIWIPEVYPGLEAGGIFVGVTHAGREIIILNCIELNNSELLELLAHFNNKKRTTKVSAIMVLKFFPDDILLYCPHPGYSA